MLRKALGMTAPVEKKGDASLEEVLQLIRKLPESEMRKLLNMAAGEEKEEPAVRAAPRGGRKAVPGVPVIAALKPDTPPAHRVVTGESLDYWCARTGKCYHRKDGNCSYSREVAYVRGEDVTNARGHVLSPCSKCKPE